MFASVNQIKNRFNKKELISILNASLLPKDGMKQILAERIFELKKTYRELCDIADDETNGILCCVCFNKRKELYMYGCRTCKEGIICETCIDNDSYGIYDDEHNNLCPICKISRMYSVYDKNTLTRQCNYIKQFSETNKISVSELCKIITTIKEEQLYEQTYKNICARRSPISKRVRDIVRFRLNIAKLLSDKLKSINIDVYGVHELTILI